ncbi:MAG: pyridoxal-phosphate dependent enzyme [Geminicoccaceae bacterium]
MAANLLRLSPAYAPTPLHDLPALARRLGIAGLLAKDEGCRALGSFKSLGGTYAGLRALMRATGTDLACLLDPARRPARLPALLCASAGNHGLAVAAAARCAGAPARIFLHAAVPEERARRIVAEGAGIVRIAGTYDDAVAAAVTTARKGDGLLVPDTTDDPTDPVVAAVVADVMAGYGVLAAEIAQQVEALGHARPTHLFVQAGVGGLAAAMAQGLAAWLAPPAIVAVVEPATAACVAAALAHGRPVRIPGALATAAGMLACGEVSAPALAVLRRQGARAVAVPETALAAAVSMLHELGGLRTTASGATGLAGLAVALASDAAAGLDLDATSRALILVTERGAEA